MKTITSGLLTATCLLVVLSAGNAHASWVTVDEYLYEGNAANATRVKGTVDATVSGNLLTLVLTNTMTTLAYEGNGSGNLLTGIGLTLPGNWLITGGTAWGIAGTAVGFTPTAAVGGLINVSKEWGYSQPPDSGHLMLGHPAQYSYYLGIGTVKSDVNDQFTIGTIDKTKGVGGPDFGVYSNTLGAGSAGGLEGVGGSLTLRLNLATAVAAGQEAAFIAGINANAVALMFASPDASVINSYVPPDDLSSVPEPASMALFALTGVGGLGWRLRRRQSQQSAA